MCVWKFACAGVCVCACFKVCVRAWAQKLHVNVHMCRSSAFQVRDFSSLHTFIWMHVACTYLRFDLRKVCKGTCFVDVRLVKGVSRIHRGFL